MNRTIIALCLCVITMPAQALFGSKPAVKGYTIGSVSAEETAAQSNNIKAFETYRDSKIESIKAALKQSEVPSKIIDIVMKNLSNIDPAKIAKAAPASFNDLITVSVRDTLKANNINLQTIAAVSTFLMNMR